MKIISKPEENHIRKECERCGTVFEFNMNDIYEIEKDWTNFKSMSSFVNCPFCDKQILIKDLSGIKESK